MFKEFVRDPSGQALAVPAEPANGLGPSGFDPSRIYDDFRVWVGEQDGGRAYRYSDNCGCAFGEFLIASGICPKPYVGGTNWDDAEGNNHDIPKDIWMSLVLRPHTFGALADRLAEAA